jgi:uncharacterized protein (DUF983 family)
MSPIDPRATRRAPVSASGSGPYGSLGPDERPRRPESVPLYAPIGGVVALLRGFRKRCPRCGERNTFATFFEMRTACLRCDLRFAREEGGFLGALTLNYVVAILAWVVLLVVVLIFTVPDVPVLPLLLASVVVMVLTPLWFYPRSKMIWAAVEFLVARSDPDYREPVARDPRAKDLE